MCCVCTVCVQNLLEAVDGALGEVYAADSLVLGGVVITLALSVAIRGSVLAARGRDAEVLARYKSEAALLEEMGVVPLPVMALDAAIALNRDANAVLVRQSRSPAGHSWEAMEPPAGRPHTRLRQQRSARM